MFSGEEGCMCDSVRWLEEGLQVHVIYYSAEMCWEYLSCGIMCPGSIMFKEVAHMRSNGCCSVSRWWHTVWLFGVFFPTPPVVMEGGVGLVGDWLARRDTHSHKFIDWAPSHASLICGREPPIIGSLAVLFLLKWKTPVQYKIALFLYLQSWSTCMLTTAVTSKLHYFFVEFQ